jgi:hypothetical protein
VGRGFVNIGMQSNKMYFNKCSYKENIPTLDNLPTLPPAWGRGSTYIFDFLLLLAHSHIYICYMSDHWVCTSREGNLHWSQNKCFHRLCFFIQVMLWVALFEDIVAESEHCSEFYVLFLYMFSLIL